MRDVLSRWGSGHPEGLRSQKRREPSTRVRIPVGTLAGNGIVILSSKIDSKNPFGLFSTTSFGRDATSNG
jgi:hypothetical protein